MAAFFIGERLMSSFTDYLKIKIKLSEKAEYTGISYDILRKVYERGSQIGNSQDGFSRVNSFISGGKALYEDKDLLTEAQDYPPPDLDIQKRIDQLLPEYAQRYGERDAKRLLNAQGWVEYNKRRFRKLDEAEKLMDKLEETLTSSASASDWVHDFVHSKNEKFKGKSKEERIRMALGAYYSKKKEPTNEDFAREGEYGDFLDIYVILDSVGVLPEAADADVVAETYNKVLAVRERTEADRQLYNYNQWRIRQGNKPFFPINEADEKKKKKVEINPEKDGDKPVVKDQDKKITVDKNSLRDDEDEKDEAVDQKDKVQDQKGKVQAKNASGEDDEGKGGDEKTQKIGDKVADAKYDRQGADKTDKAVQGNDTKKVSTELDSIEVVNADTYTQLFKAPEPLTHKIIPNEVTNDRLITTFGPSDTRSWLFIYRGVPVRLFGNMLTYYAKHEEIIASLIKMLLKEPEVAGKTATGGEETKIIINPSKKDLEDDKKTGAIVPNNGGR